MAGGSTQWRGRSVISKVVSLLDAFTPDAPELSLGDLARVTGLPVSTTYRLASELVAWGGLERADRGSGYRIGMRIRELGALAPRVLTLLQLAGPFMQDLCAATGQDVHLAVLDGREARCVHAVAGSAVPVRAHRGRRMPLHATGVGKVLLAHAGRPLFDEVCAAGLRRHTAHTVVDPHRLGQELAEIRRTGVGYAGEELTPGAQSVAAPVLDASGAVVAALAVLARRDDGAVHRLAAAVRTTAISISRLHRERSGPAAAADPADAAIRTGVRARRW